MTCMVQVMRMMSWRALRVPLYRWRAQPANQEAVPRLALPPDQNLSRREKTDDVIAVMFAAFSTFSHNAVSKVRVQVSQVATD